MNTIIYLVSITPGYFLGFVSWGCQSQCGSNAWVGLEFITEGRHWKHCKHSMWAIREYQERNLGIWYESWGY